MAPLPISCRIQGDQLLFDVPEGHSIRALERGFTDVGVALHIDRRLRRLSVPLNQGDRLAGLIVEPHFVPTEQVRQRISEWRGAEVRLDTQRAVIARLQDIGIAERELNDFPERSHLDPHQIITVAIASHPEVTGLCLFDEQGLGKTIQALFTFHRLRAQGRIGPMIVFAPKNMLLEWAHDCDRFFPGCYQIAVAAGDVMSKRRSLGVRADIYVTNFETAASLNLKLKELMRTARGGALLVVDESFFVKNPGAKRTKAMMSLRPFASRCLVLCGTPAPNSPHDLVEQVNIADGGVAFRNTVVPEDRIQARGVVRRVLETRVAYLRRLKEAVLPDLPDRAFNTVVVPMQPLQEDLYGAALHGLIDEVERVNDVSFKKQLTSFMARRAALLQLCSNPRPIVDSYPETPAKLLALDSILEELIGRRGEKVVVWSFYTRSLGEIFGRYGRYDPVRLDGTVPDISERRDAIRRFQEADGSMLMVANPAAAGAGVTLHRARYAIYESMSNQAAHYLQSLDRIHRRGQTRDVEYLMLICDRSIEVSEFARLRQKENDAKEMLMDETTPPMTRELFMRDLLSAAELFDAPLHRASR